ncbi:unnamed protein product [Knipowitschia caucasica]
MEDETASATKALGLHEPPLTVTGGEVGSDTESEAEARGLAVITEPGSLHIGPGSLQNSDEATFAEVARVTAVSVSSVHPDDNVFTTTTSGSLPEHMLSGRTLQLSEGLNQKATLIVVHTDSSIVEAAGLKSSAAITSVCSSAQTSSTPLSSHDKPSGSKYNWDPSVYNNELPVRCRETSGILYKNRLGSGGKGRCIKHNQQWFTPTEFEGLAGRASSKDWKRSIRYAGRPLLCLIQDRILVAHAASCTCASCCDDILMCAKEGEPMESEQIILGGPVRLFVPYKRRKKDGDPPVIPPKKEIPKSLTLPPGTFTVTPSGELTATTGTLSFEHSTSEEPSALDTPSEVFANATVLTALPSLGVAPQSVQGKVPLSAASSLQGAGLTLEVSPVGGVSPSGSQVDKSTWMYLEDMANTLLSNVQQLKSLIEQAKQGALMGKECRRECSLNQSFESQMGFSHSDDSDPKRSSDLNEIIMNMCVNCGRVAITECTACHKASYCSNFCQRKDWKDHQLICTGAVHDEDPMQLQCSESQK